MTDDRASEGILNTLGDDEARTILSAISEDAQSAKELADNLDFSLTTVYRRLERLEEQEIIKDRMELADDGNHYKVYESDFNKVVVSLRGGEFEVRIFPEENLPGRLADLWDDLHLQ